MKALFLLGALLLSILYPGFAIAVDSVTGELWIYQEEDFARGKSALRYEIQNSQGGRIKLKSTSGHFASTLRTGAKVSVRGKMVQGQLELAPSELTLLAEPVPAAAAALRQTLVIIADFTDARVSCSATSVQDGMFGTSNSVDGLFQEMSYGALGFSGRVVGPYVISATSGGSCDYSGWGSKAEAAAKADGVALTGYQHIVVVTPKSTCDFAGVASVGGSRSWVVNDYCALKDVYAHELSHNLGVLHAATPTTEYGDTSCIMGYGGVGLRHFNAPHKVQMGWLPSSDVVTANASGIYEVESLEQLPAFSTLPQVVKLLKSGSETYYFSFREPVSYDQILSSSYANRLNIHRWSGSGNTIYVGSLGDGEQFTDTASGISVTMLSHGASSARFEINQQCVAGSPVLTLSPSSQGGKSGGTVTYQVQVSNRDSGLCGATSFALSSAVPAGLTGTFSPTQLSVNAGATATASFQLTSASSIASGTYSFTVTAQDSSNASRSSSANGNLIIDSLAPSTPTGLAATSNKRNVNLSWLASTDDVKVTGYHIYRNGVKTATSALNSYSENPGNGTFQYQVQAFDNAGNISGLSESVSVTIGKPRRR